MKDGVAELEDDASNCHVRYAVDARPDVVVNAGAATAPADITEHEEVQRRRVPVEGDARRVTETAWFSLSSKYVRN